MSTLGMVDDQLLIVVVGVGSKSMDRAPRHGPTLATSSHLGPRYPTCSLQFHRSLCIFVCLPVFVPHSHQRFRILIWTPMVYGLSSGVIPSSVAWMRARERILDM